MLRELRIATTADAADLANIRAGCFDKRWTKNTFADMLTRPETICIILPNIAYVLVQKIPPESEIITIAVVPTHRRRGIAEHMLRDMCKKLVAYGITTLHLEVSEKLQPAQQLYAKIGFVPTGRRPNYYVSSTGEYVDAILMQLSLA